MTQFARDVGLLDLSATSLMDLSQLDDEMLEIALDRLMQPCGHGDDAVLAVGGRTRIWQNYRTA